MLAYTNDELLVVFSSGYHIVMPTLAQKGLFGLQAVSRSTVCSSGGMCELGGGHAMLHGTGSIAMSQLTYECLRWHVTHPPRHPPIRLPV